MIVDPLDTHDFEDVSYHGSPIWECRFCHVNERNALEYCVKARENRKRELAEVERKERSEYEMYLRKIARFKELKSKYGGK